MPNKLTSLTGFGEGDPKPEKKDIHPNFKAGHANMMRIAGTKHGKKVYGDAVGKAKSKALSKKMGKKDEKKIQHFKDIKDHVSGGKKSGGFKDPFWYSK